MLLLAAPLFFSLTLLIKQKIAQHQRNEKFKKETLVTITVDDDKIYWVKAEKEILFDGKLFDVKSFEKKGSKISLLGFFDHKEDKLVQQIVQMEKQKNRSGTSTIKFLFFPVFLGHPEICYEGSWKFLSYKFYMFDEMVPTSPAQTLIHPPRL